MSDIGAMDLLEKQFLYEEAKIAISRIEAQKNENLFKILALQRDIKRLENSVADADRALEKAKQDLEAKKNA